MTDPTGEEMMQMENKNITTEQKAEIIWAIIAHLRFAAQNQRKAFDAGDIFFSLCFMDEKELTKIAKLAGC